MPTATLAEVVVDPRGPGRATNGSAEVRVIETTKTTGEHTVGRYAWAVTRLSIGFVFLWAFFDKLLALGYATGVDRETGAIDRFGDAAWINGGSPTTGYLSNITGPFKSGSSRWLAQRGLTGCS